MAGRLCAAISAGPGEESEDNRGVGRCNRHGLGVVKAFGVADGGYRRSAMEGAGCWFHSSWGSRGGAVRARMGRNVHFDTMTDVLNCRAGQWKILRIRPPAHRPLRHLKDIPS